MDPNTNQNVTNHKPKESLHSGATDSAPASSQDLSCLTYPTKEPTRDTLQTSAKNTADPVTTLPANPLATSLGVAEFTQVIIDRLKSPIISTDLRAIVETELQMRKEFPGLVSDCGARIKSDGCRGGIISYNPENLVAYDVTTSLIESFKSHPEGSPQRQQLLESLASQLKIKISSDPTWSTIFSSEPTYSTMFSRKAEPGSPEWQYRKIASSAFADLLDENVISVREFTGLLGRSDFEEMRPGLAEVCRATAADSRNRVRAAVGNDLLTTDSQVHREQIVNFCKDWDLGEIGTHNRLVELRDRGAITPGELGRLEALNGTATASQFFANGITEVTLFYGAMGRSFYDGAVALYNWATGRKRSA